MTNKSQKGPEVGLRRIRSRSHKHLKKRKKTFEKQNTFWSLMLQNSIKSYLKHSTYDLKNDKA